MPETHKNHRPEERRDSKMKNSKSASHLNKTLGRTKYFFTDKIPEAVDFTNSMIDIALSSSKNSSNRSLKVMKSIYAEKVKKEKEMSVRRMIKSSSFTLSESQRLKIEAQIEDGGRKPSGFLERSHSLSSKTTSSSRQKMVIISDLGTSPEPEEILPRDDPSEYDEQRMTYDWSKLCDKHRRCDGSDAFRKLDPLEKHRKEQKRLGSKFIPNMKSKNFIKKVQNKGIANVAASRFCNLGSKSFNNYESMKSMEENDNDNTTNDSNSNQNKTSKGDTINSNNSDSKRHFLPGKLQVLAATGRKPSYNFLSVDYGRLVKSISTELLNKPFYGPAVTEENYNKGLIPYSAQLEKEFRERKKILAAKNGLKDQSKDKDKESGWKIPNCSNERSFESQNSTVTSQNISDKIELTDEKKTQNNKSILPIPKPRLNLISDHKYSNSQLSHSKKQIQKPVLERQIHKGQNNPFKSMNYNPSHKVGSNKLTSSKRSENSLEPHYLINEERKLFASTTTQNIKKSTDAVVFSPKKERNLSKLGQSGSSSSSQSQKTVEKAAPYSNTNNNHHKTHRILRPKLHDTQQTQVFNTIDKNNRETPMSQRKLHEISDISEEREISEKSDQISDINPKNPIVEKAFQVIRKFGSQGDFAKDQDNKPHGGSSSLGSISQTTNCISIYSQELDKADRNNERMLKQNQDQNRFVEDKENSHKTSVSHDKKSVKTTRFRMDADDAAAHLSNSAENLSNKPSSENPYAMPFAKTDRSFTTGFWF